MSSFDFSGQWISSTPEGFPQVIMDLDPEHKGFSGTLQIFSQVATSPSACGWLTLNTNRKTFSVRMVLDAFDAQLGQRLNRTEVDQHFPKANFPTFVDLRFERINRDLLRVEYSSNREENGMADLERCRLPKVSHLDGDPSVYNWTSFKRRIEKLHFRDYVFRGQASPFPLQTTFHRTARKNLFRFVQEDMNILHQSVVGRVKHIFNFDLPQDFGAFLNLAQHHGFPTPLLDWTYSPFVAAWFAFEGLERVRKRSSSNKKVRIFCLNRSRLMKFKQFYRLHFTVPHTSLLEALPIENERALPQQALLMSTNLQDVENHLHNLSIGSDVELLEAFDLPASEQKVVMDDLAKMGITRSTLMPGIESICNDLKRIRFS